MPVHKTNSQFKQRVSCACTNCTTLQYPNDEISAQSTRNLNNESYCVFYVKRAFCCDLSNAPQGNLMIQFYVISRLTNILST